MQSAITATQPLISERAQPQALDWRLGIPTYIYAVVFSSFCVVMGLLWDIMWHMSIGRDGLFAPPHLVIYVGAVVSGLFSAYQILSMTLTRNHPGRAEAVPFWGVFYGPLGAMFCVWGALAMLTSAPFDDWWHNTYGLDVQILTPPHTILAIGIMTAQFGAIVGVLSLQNRYRNQVVQPGSDESQAEDAADVAVCHCRRVAADGIVYAGRRVDGAVQDAQQFVLHRCGHYSAVLLAGGRSGVAVALARHNDCRAIHAVPGRTKLDTPAISGHTPARPGAEPHYHVSGLYFSDAARYSSLRG